MYINHTLIQGHQLLKDVSPSPRLDARLLMQHVLQCQPEYLIINDRIQLTQIQQTSFFEAIKLRQSGMPVSKIIGTKQFYRHDFVTTTQVLDPRPDSEILIEAVMKHCPDFCNDYKILELGVGSGCLILTLLDLYKQACGTGCDISVDALDTCRINAVSLAVSARLNLIRSNWFKNITAKYDIIISNPPYIKTTDIPNLSKDVRDFDPYIALDGGGDGLNCYRAMAPHLSHHLTSKGKVFLEIGQNQHDDVTTIMCNHGSNLIEWCRDLSGIKRCGVFQSAY